MSENYNDLFSPGVEIPETAKASDEYSPSADKGKSQIYQAIIRFIPWWKNPKHGSIQEKWVSYLVDPVTNFGRYIDCPSSIGKPSPLQDMYFKFYKSENVQERELAKIFSRRRSFSSLIEVIKDDNNSDLEGKILIWRYGIKIWEKIIAELKPLYGEKHDPFDILNGKVFALIITKVSGFNNYDQSKFLDKRIPLCIPNKEGKLIPITQNTDKETVVNWIKENSPDLSKYAFKPWDQETLDYVNHVITAITGQANVANKYADIANRGDKDKSQNKGITSSSISVEDLEIEKQPEEVGLDLEDLDISDFSDPKGITGNLDDILKGT